MTQDPARTSAQRLPCPISRARDAGGHAETNRITAAGHDHLHKRIISDHSDSPHGNSELARYKPKSMQRRLAGQHHGSARDLAHGGSDRMRMSHRLPLAVAKNGTSDAT